MTIARRQPMAIDLREIIGSIRISNDLERIGDMGKNIAKRSFAVAESRHPTKLYRSIEALVRIGADPAERCSGRLCVPLC